MGHLRLRYKPNTGGRSRKVSVPIAARHLEEDKISDDLRWSAAVAEYGMLFAIVRIRERPTGNIFWIWLKKRGEKMRKATGEK